MKFPDFEKLSARRMMEEWDRNLYVDEAVSDYILVRKETESLGKKGTLHMLAVAIGAYFEKKNPYEETETHRILDWTGLCFFNDLNNHGANSDKKNENGRLTGYWKILAPYSMGMMLNVRDRIKNNFGLESERIWVCPQTYKYISIAYKYRDIGLRPLTPNRRLKEAADTNVDKAQGEVKTALDPCESNLRQIELTDEERGMVPKANRKKQMVGKLMRNILMDSDAIRLDFETIKKVSEGEVLDITKKKFVHTVPFWDITMTDQQLEKYICGLAEDYSITPGVI